MLVECLLKVSRDGGKFRNPAAVTVFAKVFFKRPERSGPVLCVHDCCGQAQAGRFEKPDHDPVQPDFPFRYPIPGLLPEFVAENAIGIREDIDLRGLFPALAHQVGVPGELLGNRGIRRLRYITRGILAGQIVSIALKKGAGKSEVTKTVNYSGFSVPGLYNIPGHALRWCREAFNHCKTDVFLKCLDSRIHRW